MDVYMKSGLHIDVHWTSKGRLMPTGLEPSQTSTMELFPLQLSHILKTFLIRSNFLFFTKLTLSLKKLTTVKISGEKVFC